ncbi:MAG: hypothetical protein JXB00_16815 [Bacteroidales bacterium]|nr:hypothetical protein [Bacteroidales bacterium]
MKNIYGATGIFLALVLFSACSLNNEWEELEKEEIKKLETHIATLKSQGAEIVDFELGSYTWYFEDLGNFADAGESPELDDYILVDYVRRDLDGDILFTNIDSLIPDWDTYNNNKSYYAYYLFVPYKFIFGYNTPAFDAGVSLLKEGQSARIYYPSGLGFGDHVTLIDEVKLYKVIPDIEEYDSLQFAWAKNEFGFETETYLSGSDVFYKEITPGDTSIDIGTNDSLKVKFVAYYLQEENLVRFDSIWGITDQTYTVIPSTRSKVESFIPKDHVPFNKGFASAMDTIAIGTEALILVPYAKGFSNTGVSHALLGYPVVPRYTSLLYRLKVVGKKE